MVITDNFSDIIATHELKKRVQERIKKGDEVVSFSYTDYGGDFFDKVCVEYFSKEFPEFFVSEPTIYSGKNGILYGELVQEFKKGIERHLLNFRDLETFYYEMESETELNDFTKFIEDIKTDYHIFHGCLEWMIDNRSGHYFVTPQGTQFSYTNMINDLLEQKLIEKIVN